MVASDTLAAGRSSVLHEVPPGSVQLGLSRSSRRSIRGEEMEDVVSYEFVPNLDKDEEILFVCKADKCGDEVHASALRTHAAMVHNTTLYVTNMTTVRDDKRWTVRR